MTIVVLPPSANTIGDLKSIINNNFGEVELRLQDLETLSFMRSGDGNPQNNQFNNGDYYINTTDYSLWYKSEGAWSFETSLAGNPGPAGPAGTPGLNHRGLWSAATAYNINDAVRYRGSYWRAVRFVSDGTEPTTANTTSWLLVARGLNSMGSWAQGTVYRVDDLVRSDGEWYLVITNHTSTATTPFNDTTNYFRVVSKGDQGPAGPEGDQGPQGETGPQGPIGAGLINRGTWSSATPYVANDAVSYRGAFWASKTSHTNQEPRDTNTTHWQQLTRGLNPVAGAWAQGAVYRRDDLVLYQGSTYLVLADHTASATTPPNDTGNYKLFAAKGDQGIQGIQGPEGPQGDIGPTPQTYEWWKFYRGGTGLEGPITGGGWDRVTSNRTINALYIAIDSWAAGTGTFTVRLVGRSPTGTEVNIGEVNLDGLTAQKTNQNFSPNQQVTDGWHLRVDVISAAGISVNNLTVIARGV